MRRLATRLSSLLVAGLLCGCTVVIGKQPAATSTPVPTATPREIVYPTTAPVLTPTEVPTDTPVPSPTAPPTATATASPTAAPTEPPTPVPVFYTVQSGDTLSAIADAHGVTVDAIIEANSLTDPSKLSIGQQLVIPAAASTPEAAATGEPTAVSTEAAPNASTPTAEPAASATPEPTTEVSSGVTVTEGTVTLNIVDFGAALTPLRPEDVGYPYDGLDLTKVGSPTPHEYRTLVLENQYLTVTIVPDLGGRIYQIRDKVTGQSLLYNNPSIVPTNWGMRGWWLAIGGIEWAIPTEEHGLAEYLPWDAVTSTAEGEAAVTVSFTERLTGVECQVRVSLDATHSYVKITPYFRNPGRADEKVQFWINAMYAPGGASVPDSTRLVFPTGQVLLHSTSDPGLPAPGQAMPWPTYGPRDLSALSEWHGYFGAFAQPQAQAGYMGAQSPGVAGLMRAFPFETATGIKFFGLGDIPYSRYSGAEGSYLELWGGWTTSFWVYQTLTAGQSVQWDEYWYPLPDVPTVTVANEDVSLSLAAGSCTLLATSAMEAEVAALATDGTSLQTWAASLTPGHAWEATDVPTGTATIEVRNRADDAVLLRWPE